MFRIKLNNSVHDDDKLKLVFRLGLPFLLELVTMGKLLMVPVDGQPVFAKWVQGDDNSIVHKDPTSSYHGNLFGGHEMVRMDPMPPAEEHFALNVNTLPYLGYQIPPTAWPYPPHLYRHGNETTPRPPSSWMAPNMEVHGRHPMGFKVPNPEKYLPWGVEGTVTLVLGVAVLVAIVILNYFVLWWMTGFGSSVKKTRKQRSNTNLTYSSHDKNELNLNMESIMDLTVVILDAIQQATRYHGPPEAKVDKK